MSETTIRHDGAALMTSDEKSDYYRLRSDRQRRTTLQVLSDTSQDITVAELAMRVSRRLPTETPTDRIEIRLHHVHLPMLADAGVVDYDRESKRVSLEEAVSGLLTPR
jgi:DNA-binding transcriptional ArsR family regulator